MLTPCQEEILANLQPCIHVYPSRSQIVKMFYFFGSWTANHYSKIFSAPARGLLDLSIWMSLVSLIPSSLKSSSLVPEIRSIKMSYGSISKKGQIALVLLSLAAKIEGPFPRQTYVISSLTLDLEPGFLTDGLFHTHLRLDWNLPLRLRVSSYKHAQLEFHTPLFLWQSPRRSEYLYLK
jgi:hypothetical protein